MKKLLLILIFALSGSSTWASEWNWQKHIDWERFNVAHVLSNFSSMQQDNAQKRNLSLPPTYPAYVEFQDFVKNMGYSPIGSSLMNNKTFTDIGNYKVGAIRFPMWMTGSQFWMHPDLEVLAIYMLVGSVYHHDDALRLSIYVRIAGDARGELLFEQENAFFVQFKETIDAIAAQAK